MSSPAQCLRPTEIPAGLFEDMARSCGEPFAISYLSGAVARGGGITPWTRTAEIRLRQSRTAMAVLELHGLKLRAAEPYGSPHHPATLTRMAAE